MPSRIPAILLAAVLTCGLFASACAPKSVVPLRYQPISVVSSSCIANLAVVKFADGRSHTTIGKRDGGEFYPADDVTLWVTRALVSELKQSGCPVDYHDAEAAFASDYVVTGTVQEVWIEQTSFTNYHITLKVNVAVNRPTGKKPVYQETVGVELDKQVVPGTTDPTKLLTEALQDMMSGLVSKIIAATR